MLAWMAYTITVSSLLSAAAFAAEQAALSRRAPGRWIWALAIAASLALPAAVPSLKIEVPAVFAQGGPAKSIALRDMAAPALTPESWAPRQAAPAAVRFDTDAMLKLAWAAVSGCMLAGLAGCAIYLVRRKRHWTVLPMAGATVYLSEDVGPAVVGLLRPRIVVPGWLAQAPARQQELVIAHEQSHLDAGDPPLLALALLALVAMPWNLPLWWQLRRLRLAVEIDCDARVLRKGHDLQQYGAALVDIGERQSAFIGTAAPMAESRSFLEQRIRIMVRLPQRWKRRAAPALAALSLCMVAMAARVGPPLEHHAIELPAAVLQSYTGYYQLDANRVVVVSQSGATLTASINMERRLKLTPETGNGFFVRGIDIQASFIQTAAGQPASALVLRQYGVDYKAAPRVDADAVQRADDFVSERFARQAPAPGGEEILRRNLELTTRGELRLDDLSPEYGQVAQRLLPAFQAKFKNYGRVESIRFAGVNRAGWDMYRVQYGHGVLIWHLWMNPDGKVGEALALEDFWKKGNP